MKRRISDITRSTDPYDVNSRRRLEANLERKFKQLFGKALYLFETAVREEIERNPELHREFKSELFRIGNRIIQNMKKEVNCYNVQYIPVSVTMAGPEKKDERQD